MAIIQKFEQYDENNDSQGSDPYVGADPILFDSNSSYKERTMSVTNTEMGLDDSSLTCANIVGLYKRESMMQSF